MEKYLSDLGQYLLVMLFCDENFGSSHDPSHDEGHVLRVLNMARKIGETELADLEVLIPAAIFHDAVVFTKNDPRSKEATSESAAYAKKILEKKSTYPKNKIPRVVSCILECSYSKGLSPSSLESKILQDADRLEATGAISLMRTFSSGGQMNTPFYNPHDPFCETGANPNHCSHGLDLLYQRLYKVCDGMHTKTAKIIAERRHKFLKEFELELKIELCETAVWPAAKEV